MLLLPRDQETVLVFVDALCSPSCSISFVMVNLRFFWPTCGQKAAKSNPSVLPPKTAM